MKFKPNELQQIIKEEANRLKKRMMLENEKTSILKKLQEIEECDVMEEDVQAEGIRDVMQSITNFFTKPYVLNGQYLANSKNKANVMKYGIALKKLEAAGLNPVQAQEAVAILLDGNQMPSFVNGHITPVFDPSKAMIKFASTAGTTNPNAGGA